MQQTAGHVSHLTTVYRTELQLYPAEIRQLQTVLSIFEMAHQCRDKRLKYQPKANLVQEDDEP